MLLREHGHDVARGGVQWVPVHMVQVSVGRQCDQSMRDQIVSLVQENQLPVRKDKGRVSVHNLKVHFLRQKMGIALGFKAR